VLAKEELVQYESVAPPALKATAERVPKPPAQRPRRPSSLGTAKPPSSRIMSFLGVVKEELVYESWQVLEHSLNESIACGNLSHPNVQDSSQVLQESQQ